MEINQKDDFDDASSEKHLNLMISKCFLSLIKLIAFSI